jgi:hypothetical protein
MKYNFWSSLPLHQTRKLYDQSDAAKSKILPAGARSASLLSQFQKKPGLFQDDALTHASVSLIDLLRCKSKVGASLKGNRSA